MPYINEILQILASLIGTAGFGFLFNIRGKKLWFASLGGMLSWLLFLLLGGLIGSEVLRYLIVSMAMTVYAEIFARVLKTPATTFCIVSLIPLVPGGALYYTMAYALSDRGQLFIEKAIYTLELAAALSLGIVIVTAIVRFINRK